MASLYFTPDFSSEPLTESGYDHDFLRISTSTAGIISKLSGDNRIHREPMIIASGSSVQLQFVTDSFNHYRGFLLRYTGKIMFLCARL